jgi:ubiquinone/menaquinone biosynthesis C-methylase UbiE
LPDERLKAIQEFFAVRAAGWDDRFGSDEEQFRRAIAELRPMVGGTVLDVACGTGRSLPWLREAVGPDGRVLGIDATAEMLQAAQRAGRDSSARLVLGDGEALPLRDGACEAVLAAGYVPHLSDPTAGLAELARVTRAGGRLAIFHPIGRAALARRHGNVPSDDDVTAPHRIRSLLAEAGWTAESVDDGEERYLALAVRR